MRKGGLQSAQTRWQDKTDRAFSSGIWQQDANASQGPCAGLSQYPEIGASCSIDPAWKAGIQATDVSAAVNAVNRAAQDNKWLRKFVQGVTGRPATMGSR